jgi:hypothetical protein
MEAAGIFLFHQPSERILGHYQRLVSETQDHVNWKIVFNPENTPDPKMDIPSPSAEAVLPNRFLQMERTGGIQGGLLDLVIVPCAAALDADFVWILEYDVDFSGSWDKFFRQFSDNTADLLTSTVIPRANSSNWFHWKHARAPEYVAEAQVCRAFHPVMRLSRRFVQAYRDAMRDPAWQGHYEFTFPTTALVGGLQMEDIGGAGPFTPMARRHLNYENTPESEYLEPGTFQWRPSRPAYFHEAPAIFEKRDMLYHPIKAGVENWEKSILLA